MGYASVVGETVTERTVEKSRFLTYAVHAAGEEEARAALSRIRAQHPLATHVCYGFIADDIGALQRFSDDGEPQGTAGMPILGVLKARSLRETLVAVVRYFGGVKLGAGGLTRAYARCAAEGLDGAPVRFFEDCAELVLSLGYADVNAALRFLEGEEILARSFAERAEFTVAVRLTDAEAFEARAKDYFNGRAELKRGKRFVYPFPEDRG